MTEDFHPPRLSLAGLFLKFLRFGMLAFGGPVAQIAMIRQALVEEERWIAPARFNRLLAVMQVLPGPEAHELCVHFGMIARGRIGGVLAGMGFMLPGLVLMCIAAWAYVRFVAGEAGLAGVVLGVQIVILAVIVRAVARIGGHILEDRLLWAIAGAGLIATLFGVPFWIALLGGGAIYALAGRPVLAIAAAVIAIALTALVRLYATPDGSVTSAAEPVTLAALFVAGLKGGLLTFGGAYTAIPYVRDDTVGRGWIDDATFLDGVALAGLLPAPLVIFATFAGYVSGGLPGALAITAGMFFPAFAFSLIFFERLEAVVENPSLHRLLAGVAAAVVGIIAATCLQLAAVTAGRVSNAAIATALFGLALFAAWKLKGGWVVPALVAAGGVSGWLLPP